MGMIMMTKTIQWAKETDKKFIYLGSLQRPTDTYKLQFERLEWFDGKSWKTDLEEVKKTLTSGKITVNE
jgi:arginyl-tRNA--protein-N-Asp/Glu arginylyltransferase